MSDESYSPFVEMKLKGRNRRLLNEWIEIDKLLSGRTDMDYRILRRTAMGLPIAYVVSYSLHSICGVTQMDLLNGPDVVNEPLFADLFWMKIEIPDNYPCVDAPVDFNFLCRDEEGNEIPHPWHPNIRFFGEFAGHVCINPPDTFASIAWCIERVGLYLRYELYHAWSEPPYPEDLRVAQWVIKQGEPNEWVFFDQPER